MILEEDGADARLGLLFRDFRQIRRRIVAERMIRRARLAESRLILNEVAVQPGGDLAFLDDLAGIVAPWGAEANVVDLPLADRDGRR